MLYVLFSEKIFIFVKNKIKISDQILILNINNYIKC